MNEPSAHTCFTAGYLSSSQPRWLRRSHSLGPDQVALDMAAPPQFMPRTGLCCEILECWYFWNVKVGV